MLNFLELVNKRTSVRAYTNMPIEKEKIERCLEAARLAPSACNSQPWHFIVVDDLEKREILAKAAKSTVLSMNKFANQAGVHVVIVNEGSNFSARIGNALKNKQYALMDIGIATAHFCLQATEEGLGTCILGWFDEKMVRKTLSIPKKKRIELIITVGYAASEKAPKKLRKSLAEMSSYNDYK